MSLPPGFVRVAFAFKLLLLTQKGQKFKIFQVTPPIKILWKIETAWRIVSKGFFLEGR
jgi:hypothetical protein